MQIEIRSCDDWVAVYKDRRKVLENHSCGIREGLEALGIPFEDRDLHELVDDCGRLLVGVGGDAFPDTL